MLVTATSAGACGGTLVISQRAEPATFNPLTASDTNSRDIIGLLNADLIHINRYTQVPELALAKSFEVSPDRRRYTVHLRRGIRFSDGYPFDAEDVLFTFQAYLDKRTNSSQRDLLIISGTPISVEKLDRYTVLFTLAKPYAAAERLFDSIAMLPRHLLQPTFNSGELSKAWGLNTAPRQMAGLGPFQLKRYMPGQSIELERNPNYWKRDAQGNRLPYLDGIESIFVANADAEAIRFEAGETSVISRLNAADYGLLEKEQQRKRFRLYDLGPSLQYDFVVFNLNELEPQGHSSIIAKQLWFRQLAFRQAISSAIDRDGIVRLAFRGRACPISVQVTAGNKLWLDANIPPPLHSLVRAREILKHARFSWTKDGVLSDSGGNPVKFALMYNGRNTEQAQIATIAQQDLKELGIEVNLIPLEFHSLLDRIFTTFNYEAAIMALADDDADPNSEINVLRSNGSAHVWRLRSHVEDAWQQEVDRLMEAQLSAVTYAERRRMFDRVQELIAENMPVIFLISPNILVGAKEEIGNFKPAILRNYTLWNADELFFRVRQKPTEHR
ncbi:MAG: ABC transporter substrate-binding protein [Acidobacteriaceae bacterium]|nr:ABC transporter substrate-binding protein [Acidobacteriaceae bacterium]